MRKTIVVASFSLILLAVLPGCWPFSSAPVAKQKGLVVINVLGKELHDDCHIKGSINVPFEGAESYITQHVASTADIVLYCSNVMCTSSSAVRKKLIAAGFATVSVYRGGTAEWFQLDYPTVGPAQQGYLRAKLRKLPMHKDYEITATDLFKKLEQGTL